MYLLTESVYEQYTSHQPPKSSCFCHGVQGSDRRMGNWRKFLIKIKQIIDGQGGQKPAAETWKVLQLKSKSMTNMQI